MKQFYVGIGAAIEKNNKFLVLLRSPEKDVGANMWEIVTGRLEVDENPVNGLLREVVEEVGLNVEVIIPIDTGFFYRGSNDFPMIFIVYWCRYLGGEVTLSWEHSQYRWLTIKEALNDPKLELYHSRFKIIQKIKEYLPYNFKI